MVDEADELYGLPDAEFTPARDALAKRLRAEKRREDADAVKALRRPSMAAGAINRAVREHGADEVLAAGEALRAAHEALLSGDGDATGVRQAMARERDAVRDFTRLALGEGASEATEEKVRATLHAASVDDDVREALIAGRLEREAEAGADPMALLAASAGKAGGTRAGSASGKSVGSGSGKSAGSASGKSAGSASGKSAESTKPARSSSGKSTGSGSGKSAGSTKPARSGSGSGGRGRARQSDAERRRAKAAERARGEAERALAAQAEAEAEAERARSALAEAEQAARRARAVVEDLEGHERAARRAVKEAEAQAERHRTEARRAVKTAESRA
jgi:hypothetical protein